MNGRRPTETRLVEVEDLKVHFQRSKRRPWSTPTQVRALDGVSLGVHPGEILGVVGESGSGKTTLGRAILGLAPITDGTVRFDGESIDQVPRSQLRRRAQMIFQQPHASLSPRLRVRRLLEEPYQIHSIPPSERRGVAELLEMVQLGPEHADKYPHQLSGGQARRVGIARALALDPSLIIADEPTAGLDVSVGADVLNLMNHLRDQLGLTVVLITHDLNVVGQLTDRIAVMYLGCLVEMGSADDVIDRPLHPYTRGLLASVPDVGQKLTHHDEPAVTGEIPSSIAPPPGCRFHTRCPFADERCEVDVPVLEISNHTREVACHHWKRIQEEEGELAT